MSYNEAETRYHLIDPILRTKGYDSHQTIRLETPAPVEPTSPKGRRRKGPGRTDYLLCVQVGDKAARDAEAKAVNIAAAVFDLKAVDPMPSPRWIFVPSRRFSRVSKDRGELLQKRWPI